MSAAAGSSPPPPPGGRGSGLGSGHASKQTTPTKKKDTPGTSSSPLSSPPSGGRGTGSAKSTPSKKGAGSSSSPLSPTGGRQAGSHPSTPTKKGASSSSSTLSPTGGHQPGSNRSTPTKGKGAVGSSSYPTAPPPAFGSYSSPATTIAPPAVPSGGGSTMATATWSESLRRTPNQHSYIIDRVLDIPRWIRDTLANARQYQSFGMQIYDGTTQTPVTNLPGGSLPNPAADPNVPFAATRREIEDSERSLEESGEGPPGEDLEVSSSEDGFH